MSNSTTPSSIYEYTGDEWYFKDGTKLMWIALAPKLSSPISLCLSLLLGIVVFRDRQLKQKVYHRLMMVSSFANVLFTVPSFLSTWPMPRSDVSSIPWKYGNESTCRLQAFFIQFSCSRAFYNGALMIYFVLVIRWGWREQRLRRLEPWLHVIPLGWGLITSILVAALKIDGVAMPFCWIDGYRHQIYQLALYYIPVWFNLGIVTVSVLLISLHVRNVERKTRCFKYEQRGAEKIAGAGKGAEDTTEGPTEGPNFPSATIPSRKYRSRTREVTIQGFSFAIAFYILWMPFTAAYIVWWAAGKVSFTLFLLGGLITPLQGLPVSLIYFTPKYRDLRRQFPGDSVGQIFLRLISRTPEPSQRR